MGLLDGGGAALMASVFSGVYLDAQLYRPASGSDDGAGGGVSPAQADPESVKVQLEAATDAMREAEGYVDTDVRILMLAHGVAKPNVNCQILLNGVRYGIRRVGTDPATSYWDIHGRVI